MLSALITPSSSIEPLHGFALASLPVPRPASCCGMTPTTSVKKPLFKRRKLGSSPSSTVTALTLAPTNVNVAPGINNQPPAKSPSAPLACITCHRALFPGSKSGTGALLLCTRCASPTCIICSRTCTAYNRPPSYPPTPVLSHSITSSPSPSPSQFAPLPYLWPSPRRPALSLNSSAANRDMLSVAGRRRKMRDRSDDSDEGREYIGLGDDKTTCESEWVVPGCGRMLCRNCCVENVQNDGTVCVDCYGNL